MWLYRVLFNVKTRLFNQKDDESLSGRPSNTWNQNNAAADKARIIQTRIDDLDKRLAHLQSR